MRVRMNRAVQVVRNQVVHHLNRSQPTRTTASGRVIGLAPSKPGEPPKRVTSRLIQSITTAVRREGARIVGSVGSNLKYARRLELGFTGTDRGGRKVNQAPRPFLRRSLAEKRKEILRILTGKR